MELELDELKLDDLELHELQLDDLELDEMSLFCSIVEAGLKPGLNTSNSTVLHISGLVEAALKVRLQHCFLIRLLRYEGNVKFFAAWLRPASNQASTIPNITVLHN